MAKSTKVTAAPVAAPAPVVPVTTAQAILATPPVQPIAKLHGGTKGGPKVAPKHWGSNWVITVLKPKAKGEDAASASAARFNKLATGMTVAEYTKLVGAGFANGDLRWNVQRGFVGIEQPKG